MPPSKKQIQDLLDKTPTELREAESGWTPRWPELTPKQACLWWAGAKGFNPPAMVVRPFRDPNDDETVGHAFMGNVAAIAVIELIQIEAEQERTDAIASAGRVKPSANEECATPDSAAEHLVRMAVLANDKDGRHSWHQLDLSRLTRELTDEIARLRTRTQRKREQLEDFKQCFDAFSQQHTVPLVASAYMRDARRARLVREKTLLIHIIVGMGIPPLRAIAMIGDLRNGPVPVDVEHPRLDQIVDRHEKNLQGLHNSLKKATEGSRLSPIDRSVAQGGKKSDKRHQERGAP
jgi:hypothetical protein